MKSNLFAFALAVPALALLGGCGGSATNTTQTTLTDNNTVETTTSETDVTGIDNAVPAEEALSGQKFADTAAASDAYEIAAGQLAANKATTQGLKDFAATMVLHHGISTAKLIEAAGKASPAIIPDKTMTADQKANLETLGAATGADFDAAYKSQQRAAHEQALAVMQAYAASGTVPELKAFAAEAVPVVQGHLDKLKGL